MNAWRPPRSLVAAVATVAVLLMVSNYQTVPVPIARRPGLAIPISPQNQPQLARKLETVANEIAAAFPLGPPRIAPAPRPEGQTLPLTATGAAGRAILPTGRNAPGVTDTTVDLGFVMMSEYEESGETPNQAQEQAVVDYFNAHGGLAGRQIRPVFYDFHVPSGSSSEGRALEAQQACGTWTGSQPVFAFFAVSGVYSAFGDDGNDTILQCARDHHAIDVNAWPDGPLVSEVTAKAMGPYLYETMRMTAERRDRAYVSELDKLGFFSKGAKVGLIIEDSAAARDSLEHAMRPALAARGVNVVIEVSYPDPIEAPWNVYAAQFKAAGVDHVLFSGGELEAFPKLFFSTSAEAIQLRPRYGFTTGDGPNINMLGYLQPAQIVGSVGVGWSPQIDVGDVTRSPAAKRCDAIAHAANSGGGSIDYACEGLFFLEEALSRATEFSADGIAAGVDKLGTAHQPVLGLGTRFGPANHDGPLMVRGFAYSLPGPRFVYVNAPHEAGTR